MEHVDSSTIAFVGKNEKEIQISTKKKVNANDDEKTKLKLEHQQKNVIALSTLDLLRQYNSSKSNMLTKNELVPLIGDSKLRDQWTIVASDELTLAVRQSLGLTINKTIKSKMRTHARRFITNNVTLPPFQRASLTMTLYEIIMRLCPFSSEVMVLGQTFTSKVLSVLLACIPLDLLENIYSYLFERRQEFVDRTTPNSKKKDIKFDDLMSNKRESDVIFDMVSNWIRSQLVRQGVAIQLYKRNVLLPLERAVKRLEKNRLPIITLIKSLEGSMYEKMCVKDFHGMASYVQRKCENEGLTLFTERQSLLENAKDIRLALEVIRIKSDREESAQSVEEKAKVKRKFQNISLEEIKNWKKTLPQQKPTIANSIANHTSPTSIKRPQKNLSSNSHESITHNNNNNVGIFSGKQANQMNETTKKPKLKRQLGMIDYPNIHSIPKSKKSKQQRGMIGQPPPLSTVPLGVIRDQPSIAKEHKAMNKAAVTLCSFKNRNENVFNQNHQDESNATSSNQFLHNFSARTDLVQKDSVQFPNQNIELNFNKDEGSNEDEDSTSEEDGTSESDDDSETEDAIPSLKF